MNFIQSFIEGRSGNFGDTANFIASVLPFAHIGLTLLFLTLSVILAYHWRRYGVGRAKSSIFMLIYFLGGLVFIAAMTTARLSF